MQDALPPGGFEPTMITRDVTLPFLRSQYADAAGFTISRQYSDSN
jgi:hypothetical protein